MRVLQHAPSCNPTLLYQDLHSSTSSSSSGLERVGRPHVKHLEGRLWEIRMKGRDEISRALYITAAGKRVIVVRVFIKKTQKTPRHEIELALKRAKGVVI